MARDIKLRADSFWYCPLYATDEGAARDSLYDADPFKVKVRPLTSAEVKKLQEDQLGKPAGRDTNFMRRAHLFKETLIADAVLEVSGYRLKIEKTGEVIEPKNGKQLVAAIAKAPDTESSILDDIIEAARGSSSLRPDLPNESSSPSASG